jgi:polar amino acid transport system substrate-binding protein
VARGFLGCVPSLLGALLVLPGSSGLLRGGDGPVRIVTENLPPFSFKDGSTVRGASTEVVRAVMDEAGLPYTIEVLPWKRALDIAQHERDTFIYSVARTEEREGSLAWIGKICDRTLALYCLRERKDLIGHPLSSLGDATIAVIQGDASIEALRKLGFGDRNLHVLRDAAAELAAIHVEEGRSDFFVSNPYRMEYGLKGTPLEGRFVQHSIVWQGDGYYLAANPASDPHLLSRVGTAFAAMSASGRLRQLFEQSLRQSSR